MSIFPQAAARHLRTLGIARDDLSVVASDHKLLGFSHLYGPRGTMAVSPMVSDIVDEALFADLKAMGLRDDSDARHLMYAVENKCDRFVTLDPDFLDRRDALHVRCPTIRIVRPSELAAELKLCQ